MATSRSDLVASLQNAVTGINNLVRQWAVTFPRVTGFFERTGDWSGHFHFVPSHGVHCRDDEQRLYRLGCDLSEQLKGRYPRT